MSQAKSRIAGRIAAFALAAGLLLSALPAVSAGESTPGQRELGSNRYTQVLAESEALTGFDLEGFELLMENETLAVYYREQTGGIRVQDKRSGYVWGMMAQDKPENLNTRWAAIANSLVMAEVYDSQDKLVFAGAQSMECTVRGNTAVMDVYFDEWQLGFTFEMTLNENALTFSMSDDSIREEGEYRLASVTFAPFFGAVEGDSVPGYVFLPDGCGALMRFLSPRNYLQGYAKRIYGADYAIDAINSAYTGAQNTTLEEQTVTLPVFGMTHGERQNAFLAVAQQGEEYGTITADPAGLVCDYTRANVKFVYRQMYEQPISRVGVGVQTVQAQPNRVDPQISYYFLTGQDAGYTGMARQYQSLLVEAGVLTRREWDETVPLRVDFLAADVQKEFIGTSVNVATSAEAVLETAEQLRQAGVEGLSVGLLGWQKGGLHGYDKTASASKTVYGGLDALEQLGQEVPLSLVADPFSAKEGQFNTRSEGAISLSQTLVMKQGDEDAFLGDTYYLKPAAGLEALQTQTRQLTDAGLENFVFNGLGELLYGEYLTQESTSRTQVRQQVEQAAGELEQLCGPLTLTRPNAYLLAYAGACDQTPMTGSQFLYETDTVPFLQMVLSGYVELYAPYTNLSFYSRLDLLKMIDFNTCPTYLLTEKDNYALRNTASADLCSTVAREWVDSVAETYRTVSEVLGEVRGQVQLDRRVLETGLVENTYEEGVVYVNYNETARTLPGGTTLPALSAVYLEGGDAR